MKLIDIVIGNNFMGLHPSGGQEKDSVENLRAYHSLFGHGWVLAGTHPDINPGRCTLSPSAVNLARAVKCEVIPELFPGFW